VTHALHLNNIRISISACEVVLILKVNARGSYVISDGVLRDAVDASVNFGLRRPHSCLNAAVSYICRT